MSELGWLGSQLIGAEKRVLARAKEQGLSDRETENLVDQQCKKTKKERKAAAKRATTVNNNPTSASNSTEPQGSSWFDRSPESSPTASIVLGRTITDEGVIADLRQHGTGPVPSSVFNRYFCNAELIGMLFGGAGQPLWQGRSHRSATRRQLE